ncbi:MAG: NTP transferase domain-containing protein [Bdellovibrionales bacterium]|nr:NTP transferase domain-containing protein [Bdellovibrionales bacterium]
MVEGSRLVSAYPRSESNAGASMRGWGVVLAGGKSTRMGQDKRTLSWQGETLDPVKANFV